MMFMDICTETVISQPLLGKLYQNKREAIERLIAKCRINLKRWQVNDFYVMNNFEAGWKFWWLNVRWFIVKQIDQVDGK